ncbi:MAG: ABC transporter ATP-binding protein [Oscillospiraceae bacterium]|nr:ABC transporter ATP-binding protein [Oscillospiraceae bacterium]
MSDKLLKVDNLRVSYHTYAGEVQAVRGVSFELDEGETLALVGESGCGKSVTARSLMRLNKVPPAEIKAESRVLFQGENIYDFDQNRLRRYRGQDAAMIFQDAMAALNPTMTIGKQVAETLLHHQALSKKAAREQVRQLLQQVGISEPERRLRQYPHELSGGMRQRVMIAIAFANQPRLLIADEPTTALDVTIQAQIIDLMKQLQQIHKTAVIMITHDLGVVANLAQRIAVMYAGTIVERGSSREIFYHPRHPYTNMLLEAVPRLDQPEDKELASIAGTPPDLLNPPPGCPFCSRCRYCMDICLKQRPPVYQFEPDHQADCWLYALEKPAEDAPFTRRDDHE